MRRQRDDALSPAEFYETHAEARLAGSGRHYQRLIRRYYQFLVPEGRHVLELGCGGGDLLAALKPSRGVGIDFSPTLIEEARRRYPKLAFQKTEAETFAADAPFDYIVLSDLVNDLPDVQALLRHLRHATHARGRLVLNFFNHLWHPLLRLGERLGLKAPTPPQNWLSEADLVNLLHLAGWELIKSEPRILWPIRTPGLELLLNRILAPLLPPLCLTRFLVARPKGASAAASYTCSVVIPARNEAGNIDAVARRTPEMGRGTELIFVEGGSKDETWETIQQVRERYPDRNIRALQQQGRGKGDAVREGFAAASGDLFFILDADLSVAPEQLSQFYEVLHEGMADFANGVRLVYPMEHQAMRFFNMLGNKFFSLAFSWLLGQRVKDTLCGTKVLPRADYEEIMAQRRYFGELDPFGDFDLLFGAAKLNLKIADLPVRYHARTYGETNIRRWHHAWLLFKMLAVGAKRLKFI